MCNRTLIGVLALLLGPTVPMALAQHGHEEGEHGKPAEFTMPKTYKAGVAEIQHRLHEIEELIESKDLDKVHSQADVIQKVGNVLGQLALKPDSGVPREAVKEVNKAARQLAAQFDAIDKAGDSGDLEGTRTIYEEMVNIASTLQKYVARTFACPMKCEGDKTYPAAGKCPKCGMALKEVMANRGPHGGLLAWSADRKCQIEATLSKNNEVRVYLCDEQSKPLAADRAAVQAHAEKEEQHKPVSLTPDPTKSFLIGKVDLAMKPPLTLAMTVDFKDGNKAQTINFDFDSPTDAPHKEHREHRERREHRQDEHEGHRP